MDRKGTRVCVLSTFKEYGNSYRSSLFVPDCLQERMEEGWGFFLLTDPHLYSSFGPLVTSELLIFGAFWFVDLGDVLLKTESQLWNMFSVRTLLLTHRRITTSSGRLPLSTSSFFSFGQRWLPSRRKTIWSTSMSVSGLVIPEIFSPITQNWN